MIRPTGVPPSTRTFLGAPPTPRFGVSEAKVANPGRKSAPRERDGLFDIVRRSASAVAAHFGETNPTDPTRVVPAKAGTHNHGLWLWVPALRPLRGRRPGRRSFIKMKYQPAAVENDRWFALPVSGPVIYRERRNSNVS